jgi:membrane-associated phospholipid phosphatase
MSRTAAAAFALSLSVLSPAFAQAPERLVNHAAFPPPAAAPVVELPLVDDHAKQPGLELQRARVRPAAMPGLADPFKQFPNDLKRFFSADTFRVVGIGGAMALAASSVDHETVLEAREHLQPAGRFSSGNVGGGFLVQTGAAFGALALGKVSGNSRLAGVGADLARAQLVSQTFVQALKFTTGRTRPDGSNTQSFPSGHTASAAATASVLQRHFGWKVGGPAYAFAGYVAAARMSADKHHLSDVLMGAAIGIAAGRTVTIGVAGEKFNMGVSPTVGGAAVTFTKR